MSATLLPTQHQVKNLLLAATPAADYEYLSEHLERVTLSGKESIHLQGDSVNHLYFPLDCIVSSSVIMNDGSMIEVYMLGRESATGIGAIFGEYVARNWVRVLVPGSALRLRSEIVRDMFRRSSAMQRLLMRAYRAAVTQISQRAVCNGRHTILHRLSTWLLMVHDRVGSDNIPLTQEAISGRLGARRASITQAARYLQEAEAISYSRGKIHIDNRELIEQQACECYEVMRREFNCFKRVEEREREEEEETPASRVLISGSLRDFR